jgi:quercetin dioxygenase-like cupin family protein
MAEKSSLTALARRQLELARQASSGRSAHTVFGGHEHVLRQTLVALAAGHGLDEHESPGDATVHVLHGRVRLSAGTEGWEGSPGDLLIVPAVRHTLDALEDSTVLLTVGMGNRRGEWESPRCPATPNSTSADVQPTAPSLPP